MKLRCIISFAIYGSLYLFMSIMLPSWPRVLCAALSLVYLPGYGTLVLQFISDSMSSLA